MKYLQRKGSYGSARKKKIQKLQISQNEILRKTILPVFSQFL